MNKATLRAIAKQAATTSVGDQVSLDEAIAKHAAERRPNDDQLQRIVEFANHAVNAKLAESVPYTTFELATLEGVKEALDQVKVASGQEVPSSLFMSRRVSAGRDKTASEEAVDPREMALRRVPEDMRGIAEEMSTIADFYGVDLPLSHNKEAMRTALVQCAGDVLHFAAGALVKTARQMDGGKEEVFEQMRKALLSGVPIEKVIHDMKQKGYGRQARELLPRLEALYLIKKKTRHEDGPQSLKRRLKEAREDGARKLGLSEEEVDLWEVRHAAPIPFQDGGSEYTLRDDAPLMKAAARVEEAREDLPVHLGATEACLAVLQAARHGEDQSLAKRAGFKMDAAKKVLSGLTPKGGLGEAARRVGQSATTKAQQAGEVVGKATAPVREVSHRVGRWFLPPGEGGKIDMNKAMWRVFGTSAVGAPVVSGVRSFRQAENINY